MIKYDKTNGAYYTPSTLANFMVAYIIDKIKYKKSLNIMEPGCGDGVFLKALFENKLFTLIKECNLNFIEKRKRELNKAIKLSKNYIAENVNFNFIHEDYLTYSQKTDDIDFDLVIGNPPYINKKYLTQHQIKLCEEIHFKAGLKPYKIKNIWSAFLIGAIKSLKQHGIVAFILPSELLQVKFSYELREFLQREFCRIEVFTFSDLLFGNRDQDTIILFGFKSSEHKGIFYTNIHSVEDLKHRSFSLKQNKVLLNTQSKWTHHILKSEELELIYKLKNEFGKVDNYCNSKAGIVTAANSYFIVDRLTVNQFNLHRFVKPIVQRGIYANGNVVFAKDDYNLLWESDKPCNLLCFDNANINNFDPKTKEYLQLGIQKKINKRYKCKLRKHWYVVPNVSTPPDGFFFKRSHLYPKLIKNDANVWVADAAYKVEMKDEYDINSLIYSFYNSLTLTFAELDGRYYGGGVLELTPNEFKNLPIFYKKINASEFKLFSKTYQRKNNTEELLELVDQGILLERLNISCETLHRIRDIRDKLIHKRIKSFKKLLS